MCVLMCVCVSMEGGNPAISLSLTGLDYVCKVRSELTRSKEPHNFYNMFDSYSFLTIHSVFAAWFLLKIVNVNGLIEISGLYYFNNLLTENVP